MKNQLACCLILTHTAVVFSEVVFLHEAAGGSVQLSCSPGRAWPALTGLHLYHSGRKHLQLTLLSLEAQGSPGGGTPGRRGPGTPTLNTEHRGRLLVSGGLDARRVNATLTRLEPQDTGLYTWWETTEPWGDEGSQGPSICTQVFLLVEGADGGCSARRPLLLSSIFTAAGLLLLLLLLLLWLLRLKQAGPGRRLKPQPPVPIYEEMSGKGPRGAGSPHNELHEGPAPLQEAAQPIYANPGTRHVPENYYACPRQIAHRV